MPTPVQQVPVRGLMLAGAAAACVMLAGVVGWGSVATLSGAVIAPGQIISDAPRQEVQHPTGGVIEELAVGEGAQVAAGEVLALLDMRAQQAELAMLEDQIFDLELRLAGLQAAHHDRAALFLSVSVTGRAAGKPALLARIAVEEDRQRLGRERLQNELAALSQAIGQQETLAEGLAAQTGALERQAQIVAAALARQRSLVERALVPPAAVLELEREDAALQERLARLLADGRAAEKRRQQLAGERAAREAGYREQITEALQETGGTLRRLKGTADQLRLEIERAAIRAPVAGVVQGLSLAGAMAVLAPGDVLLSIVPPAAQPLVSVRVPTASIDLLQDGQPVALRFSSLDATRTPMLTGRVAHVPPEPVAAERSGALHYVVEVRLDAGEQARLPQGTALITGMPVEAMIRTEDRTPLALLIKPLSDYFARSFQQG